MPEPDIHQDDHQVEQRDQDPMNALQEVPQDYDYNARVVRIV